MSDNGPAYVSKAFAKACRTRAYTPRTNGKAERFIQNLCKEWAYAMAFPNSEERNRWLPRYLAIYNRLRKQAGAHPSSGSLSCSADEPGETLQLGGQILDTVKAQLSASGMTMRQGTISDAPLIAAPSSTMNKVGKRDPEMHQNKKGNQWYFGMKVHAGVDKDSGLIHSVVVTAGNVHNLTPAAELLHSDGVVVYGDGGYPWIAKRPEIASKTTEF